MTSPSQTTAQHACQTLPSNIPLPPALDMQGSLADKWRKWRQVWDSYEVIASLKAKPQEYRLATFITCTGPAALDVYNGLPFEQEDDRKSRDTVINLMEKHCIGETNVIYERYVFNNRNQEANESIDAYATALRTLAATCDFGHCMINWFVTE